MLLSPDLYRRIVTSKIFIDNHYQEKISLEAIAGQALLSSYHFHRLFRKVYKITPHQYLTRKRLEKARSLLSENKPVHDVCNEIGYESPGSFSILFKKEIGFAPQYYRNWAFRKKKEQEAEPRRAIPHCFYSQLFRAKKSKIQ